MITSCFAIFCRYEFQTGKGSGNLPHVHSLYSISNDEDKQKIFDKISAMETSFKHENEKFPVKECVDAGKKSRYTDDTK